MKTPPPPSPRHRARPVRSLRTLTAPQGEVVHYSIEPEQIPAMQRALTRTILIHCAPCGDLHFVKVWAAQCARGCLTTLGLIAPKT